MKSYNQRDHIHCWQQENSPCGIKSIHRCCLCELPSPGSEDSQKQGCECAVIDNHYGKGFNMGDGELSFWYTQSCPIHGFTIDLKIIG